MRVNAGGIKIGLYQQGIILYRAMTSKDLTIISFSTMILIKVRELSMEFASDQTLITRYKLVQVAKY